MYSYLMDLTLDRGIDQTLRGFDLSGRPKVRQGSIGSLLSGARRGALSQIQLYRPVHRRCIGLYNRGRRIWSTTIWIGVNSWKASGA